MRIVSKYYAGISLIGYGVEDTDSTRIVGVNSVIKLCIDNQIDNANLVYDSIGEIYHIDVHDDVEIVNAFDNKKDSIEIKSREIDDNGNTLKYTVLDSEYKLHKIDLKKMWELALYGEVKGVKAALVSGRKALFGEDISCNEVLQNKGEE